MNKKITSSVLAALMMAGLSSTTTFAAMDKGTVVIGNKAFDFEYANDPLNASEITDAIVTGGGVYVKNFSGDWVNNQTGTEVLASVIPAVVYKSATETVNFNPADTDATPVLETLSYTIGQAKTATKDANGDFKVSLAGLSNTAMFTTLTLEANKKASVKIDFNGMSKTVTTNDSGDVTIVVANLLGGLDTNADGISVGSLKNILTFTDGTGKITATLKDEAGNEKITIINISAN